MTVDSNGICDSDHSPEAEAKRAKYRAEGRERIERAVAESKARIKELELALPGAYMWTDNMGPRVDAAIHRERKFLRNMRSSRPAHRL